MLKTDWLKVATAGRTVDGREIKKDWLAKMAASYSPQVYTAGVNSEHFFYPGLGHVTELKADTDEMGRLALYARIAPTAELLSRYQNRRQLFFSVEVMADFPAKGDIYLSGLAITDLPASQGLEPARFNAEIDGRQRFFDTSTMRDGESEPGEVAPTISDNDTPPRWWAALWSALMPHLAAGPRHDNQENEHMTDQERAAFDALKTEVERLSARIQAQAEHKSATQAEALERFGADMEVRINQAEEGFEKRLSALEVYMDAPVEGEQGEVTGPAPGGEDFVC